MWRANLILIAAAACFVTTCHAASVLDAAQDNQRFLGTMNKYLITTWGFVENGTDIQEVPNTEEGIEALDFLDGTQNVAIVVHGRAGSASSQFGQVVSNSLIKADQTMAVILVDWSWVSTNYEQAFAGVPSIAEDLIKFIVQMEESDKLDRNLLHLIGFDLGAHVVGITSRNPTARARKITALDPAGQGWDMFSPRLRATDAQLVEVIHTDGVGVRAFGIGEPLGHLDFFANGGTRQPGCVASNNQCHHDRAWELFAATVEQNGHLSGMRCDTMVQVNNNRCVGIPSEVMGSNALVKVARGVYRVNTGRTWPY